MNEEPVTNGEKTDTNRDSITGKFLPHNNANPEGRPKGRFSITSQMIKRLEENPEEMKTILQWFVDNRKDLIWNKIDPNPPTDLNMKVDVPQSLIELFIHAENNPQGGIGISEQAEG